MKAILPAAGFGTRFLPISKAVPKEMLPLGAKPVIQLVVEEAVAAGVDEIIIVISEGKEIIRQFFEPAPALCKHLRSVGKNAEAESLEHLSEMARFSFCYQPEMRGLGDAVLCGADLVGNEPFAVMLADTVIHGTSPLSTMRSVLESSGRSVVALERCAPERVSRYGIVGGREIEPGIVEISGMVEKPSLSDAPQVTTLSGEQGHFAFAARYFFQPGILDTLRRCAPGKNGEIQLTDAMRDLLGTSGFHGVISEGTRLDIGNPGGLAAALPLFA